MVCILSPPWVGHRCLVRIGKGPIILGASAVMAAVVLGTLGAALSGALLAVGGLASAALWEAAVTWRQRIADRAERLKVAERTYALPIPVHDRAAGQDMPIEGGVARYLRPEAKIVSFWPRAELEQLILWISSPRHDAIQLVTGEGGTGKTRLALQLVEEASALGWRTQWVPAGTELGAVGAARDAGKRVLLVVDYAETRTTLQALLVAATDDEPGPEMRVLLLARSAGEWWRQLIDSSSYQLSEMLAAVQPIQLGPVSESSRQRDVFMNALRAFAAEFGVACPDVMMTLTDQNAVVLVVHAAALLAVLDHGSLGTATATPRNGPDALAGLLRHEARYWQQSQAARGLGLDPDVVRRAVAAGCLVGADDESAANELLAHLADLADSAQLRGKVARWLHDLYPASEVGGAEKEWIGLLRPDPIAEQFVVSVLSRQSDMIPALFTGLAERRAARGLTLLARAALTDQIAMAQFDSALRSDVESLTVPALAVAVETNPVVGDLIKRALVSCVLSSGALVRIAAALPHSSLALAEAAVVVFQCLVEQSARNSARRGDWLIHLGKWLSDLGRGEEALASVKEAVTLYRELAPSRPAAELTPRLAVSLNKLSQCLSDLGRREEALAAAEEAVTLSRMLAQTRVGAFLPDLALSLNTKSSCLVALGRREEALAAIEEAIALHRELAPSRPGAFLPHLAGLLNNRSICLSDLGRRDEVLAPAVEAVNLFRELAAARPDAFLPDLALSLNNECQGLSNLGRWEEALAAAEEAVTLRRMLAQTRLALSI